jgi:hypothetical protein
MAHLGNNQIVPVVTAVHSLKVEHIKLTPSRLSAKQQYMSIFWQSKKNRKQIIQEKQKENRNNLIRKNRGM